MPKITDILGTIRSNFQIGLKTATVQARSILFRSQFTGTLTWTPTADRTLTLPDITGSLALSNPTVESIAALPDADVGLLRKTGADTVSVMVPSATGEVLITGTIADIKAVLGISKDLVLNSSISGSSASITLTGQSEFPGVGSLDGIKMFASYNAAGNRQVAFADTAGGPLSGALRILILNGVITLDGVTKNGAENRDLSFGSPSRNTSFGATPGTSIPANSKSAFYGEIGKNTAVFYSQGGAPVQFVDQSGVVTLEIDPEKRSHRFTQSSAAAQSNGSLFMDSATGKLSFKDGAGVVNALY